MKKLLLVGVAALFAAVALPLAAAPTLGVSGEVTYGVISNGSATVDGWPNAFVNLTATLDPNNLAALELYANSLPKVSISETGQLVPPNVGFLYFRSDLAGDMGMDTKFIDPVLYAGYGVVDLPGYSVTQYGNEAIAALGIDNGTNDGIFGNAAGSAYGLVALNTGVMGMANIVLAASGTAFNPVSATNSPQALVGAYGTVGPVSLEAGWTMHGTSAGFVPVGAKVSYSLMNINLAATGQYVANLSSGGVSNWSAGASASYQGAYTVDFAVLSYEPAHAPATTALKGTGDVVVSFGQNYGALASVYLNFDPAAAAVFDTLETSAWAKMGPAKVRLGYLYGTTGLYNLGTPALNAPANNGGRGGVFLTADLSF